MMKITLKQKNNFFTKSAYMGRELKTNMLYFEKGDNV